MCKICSSIYGHSSACPEYSPRSDVFCVLCECEMQKDEEVVITPKGYVFCRDCLSTLDMHDFCLYFDVDNPFELVEKYNIRQIKRIGRYQ